jgi:hypothetical protein
MIIILGEERPWVMPSKVFFLFLFFPLEFPFFFFDFIMNLLSLAVLLGPQNLIPPSFSSASGHIDDMTNLPELSETSILKNLQARYTQEIIYTYTGTILVACNPYKWITIYEDVRFPLFPSATSPPLSSCFSTF